MSLPKPTPNNPLELTAHSAGFCGYSWRFPLGAAAHRERWAAYCHSIHHSQDGFQEMQPHNHQVVMNRFVAACQADERVVAATLYGSYARGAADAYSDLDLGLSTTDAAYEDFVAGREAFRGVYPIAG